MMEFSPSFDLTETQINKEIWRAECRYRYKARMFTVLVSILAITAAAWIAVTLWTPVMRLSYNEQIVLGYRTQKLDRTDMAVFQNGDDMIMLPVTAVAGDHIKLDVQGRLTVNGALVDAATDSMQPFEMQVPDECYFFLGNGRTCFNSENNQFAGCLQQEHVVAKALISIWPLQQIEFFR